MASIPAATYRALMQRPQLGVKWDETAMYLLLTQRLPPPGGRTSYVVARPAGSSPTDVTTFVYGQAEITIDTWPEVMYMLEPTKEWEDFKSRPKPKQKKNLNGQFMWERFQRANEDRRPLLDFAILPDNISSEEDWWWFDLWRRMDPRMSIDDITMRIEAPGRTRESDQKLRNRLLNMEASRQHLRYCMLSWFGTGKHEFNNKTRDQVLAKMAENPVLYQHQLHNNTTRGSTPGLINPALGPNSARVPQPTNPKRCRRRGPNPNKKRRNNPIPNQKVIGPDDEENYDDLDTGENEEEWSSEDEGGEDEHNGNSRKQDVIDDSGSLTLSETASSEEGSSGKTIEGPRRRSGRLQSLPKSKSKYAKARKQKSRIAKSPKPGSSMRIAGAVRIGLKVTKARKSGMQPPQAPPRENSSEGNDYEDMAVGFQNNTQMKVGDFEEDPYATDIEMGLEDFDVMPPAIRPRSSLRSSRTNLADLQPMESVIPGPIQNADFDRISQLYGGYNAFYLSPQYWLG